MDTLIGALVIVLAVMVPPQPGIGREALASSSDMPLAWSYSHSTYTQRIPIVALAFVGLFISRYLAAFQLGHFHSVWDRFFGTVRPTAAAGIATHATQGVTTYRLHTTTTNE